MVAEFQIPGVIVHGAGALDRIAEVMAKIGMARPLVVTDRGLAGHALFAGFRHRLDDLGVSYGVFSDILPDPDLTAVEGGVKAYLHGNYDGLIGFGGGSAMDTAKAINLHMACDGDIAAWRVPKAPSMPVLPLLCIPTTAGTGSEVTRAVVITNPQNHEKMLFMGLSCVPTATIVDADLTAALPARVAADTGLDALTHALEAYVSRKANPLTDVIALDALRLIGPNLVSAATVKRLEAREAMMLGATLAGMAFSNASVALVHGMSRPLGSFFGMPHGTSNAVLLPAVTAFSLPAAEARYGAAARALGMAKTGDDDLTACNRLVAGLEELVRVLEVPSLEAFGIDRAVFFDKLPIMVEQAMASGSPNNNPRIATADEIGAIYRGLWN
jgi:alcohol dehydrogenase class IV